MNRGRTLVEIVIVVLILSMLLAAFSWNLSKYLDSKALDEAGEAVFSLVQEARTLTLSSYDPGCTTATCGKRYGIRLNIYNGAGSPKNTAQIIFFDPATGINIYKTYTLPSRTVITTSTAFLPPGTCLPPYSDPSYMFERLTGSLTVWTGGSTFTPICQTNGVSFLSQATIRLARTPANPFPQRVLEFSPSGSVRLVSQ
jgi:type II secretory pathway pseudopilin PulG